MKKVNTTVIAIVIGFGLVAGAVFLSGSSPLGDNNSVKINGGNGSHTISADLSPKREENRFVYGNIDAPVTIVEFSDFECPFCARLHPTLKRIVDESDGQINWEYRHLPLPSHRNAELAAAVVECVGRNIGNKAFWEYGDIVFNNQRSVNGPFLTGIASDLGLPEDELQTCINTDEIRDQVRTDLATARALGGSGTPFSVVVYADGSIRPVSGALPYENWRLVLGL